MSAAGPSLRNVSVEMASGHGPKVVGVGFHKTGTTSLGAALEILGYRVCQGARALRTTFGDRRMMRMLETNRLEHVQLVATKYDAFRDNPWYLLYAELDRWFPGSKFILTTRDSDAWLASAIRYFGRSESAFRRWIYGADAGSPVGNERVYVERYRRHEREVRAYFRDRQDDLLIVDWDHGDGWPQLARFLDRAEPAIAFPWENATRATSHAVPRSG